MLRSGTSSFFLALHLRLRDTHNLTSYAIGFLLVPVAWFTDCELGLQSWPVEDLADLVPLAFHGPYLTARTGATAGAFPLELLRLQQTQDALVTDRLLELEDRV